MTFKDYLRANNIPENLDEIRRAEIYKKYRIWYKRHNERERRAKFKRVEIMLEPSDFNGIKRQADQHRLSVGAFIKNATLAYLEQLYVVPDESQIQKLETAIHKIGTNINQIAFQANKNKLAGQTEIQALKRELDSQRRFITQALKEPTNLNFLVTEALKTYPNYKAILQRLINQQP